MDGTMAVVTCFAADFSPRNWRYCNGDILAISTNQALFALLGTTYGGDGVTNFALPDLRGRTPVCPGQGPGLSTYNLGQKAGAETVTLTVNNLAAHNHNGKANLNLPANTDPGIDPTPNAGYPSEFTGAYALPAAADTTMLSPVLAIENAGSGQPVPIRSPYLAMNYVICVAGIFPSRN